MISSTYELPMLLYECRTYVSLFLWQYSWECGHFCIQTEILRHNYLQEIWEAYSNRLWPHLRQDLKGWGVGDEGQTAYFLPSVFEQTQGSCMIASNEIESTAEVQQKIRLSQYGPRGAPPHFTIVYIPVMIPGWLTPYWLS